MALIVGGQTVTTDEAGTNKLDATKLFGDLPAINGASLTGVSTSVKTVTDGATGVGGNSPASITAPSSGFAVIWGPPSAGQGGTTIAIAKDGATASATNHHGDTQWFKYFTVEFD